MVMAKDVHGAATQQLWTDKGRGDQSRRRRTTRNKMRLNHGEAACGCHSQNNLENPFRSRCSFVLPTLPHTTWLTHQEGEIIGRVCQESGSKPVTLVNVFLLQQLPLDMDLQRLAPEQPRTGKPLPCDEHESWPTNLPNWPQMGVSLFTLRCAIQSFLEPKGWLLHLSSPSLD